MDYIKSSSNKKVEILAKTKSQGWAKSIQKWLYDSQAPKHPREKELSNLN